MFQYILNNKNREISHKLQFDLIPLLLVLFWRLRFSTNVWFHQICNTIFMDFKGVVFLTKFFIFIIQDTLEII